MDTNYAPIILFSYNRPQYLRVTLEALSKNYEAQFSTLYIYCDGPKPNASDEDLRKINEVRTIAKSRKWCLENIIIEREKNMGLSKSVIAGITELLDKQDKVIVLEDDLETSPYFLNYMNTALEVYKNEENVISIVGFNYPLAFENLEKETYFIKNADCFGWATWKRGWAFFEADASVLIEKIESNNATKEFNFNNNYPFMKMLKSVTLGKVDSWAIRWYASSFVNRKLTLFPKRSLVRNIGNMGTHIKADNSDLFGFEISDCPVTYFEPEISQNNENWLLLSKHFRKYNRRRLSISSIKYAYKRFISSYVDLLFKKKIS